MIKRHRLHKHQPCGWEIKSGIKRTWEDHHRLCFGFGIVYNMAKLWPSRQLEKLVNFSINFFFFAKSYLSLFHKIEDF